MPTYEQFNPEEADCTLISWINAKLGRERAVYFECCVEHDRGYFHGGTKEQRKECDVVFRDCVVGMTNKYWGWAVYIAVRLFGSPRFPTALRWARRTPIKAGITRGYGAGTDEETGHAGEARGDPGRQGLDHRPGRRPERGDARRTG